MTNFEFVDNIPSRGKGGRRVDPVLIEFAEALRDNPGRWAKYPHTPTSQAGASATAHLIRAGHPSAAKPFRGGDFDAAVRQGVLYVRFIGGGS